MTLNIFRTEPNKPMIYNLASAERFLSQCNNPFKCRLHKNGLYLEAHKGIVRVVSTEYAGNIGIDLLHCEKSGKEAVSLLYEHRKYINRHFNR